MPQVILLVEDDVVAAMAGKRVLERHGYAVVLADGAAAAVAACGASPAIDLV